MMNQEEAKANFGYEATADELQKVILEWAAVTDAFHSRYARLNQVIHSLQTAARREPAAYRARLWKLIELRDHMSDVLMTLLVDMSGQRAGHSMQPSKPGQLHTHASLLSEMTRKIDTELISFTTVAQA